jgi:acyl-CoA thioesterase
MESTVRNNMAPATADIVRLATRDPFVTAVGVRAVDAGPGHATVALDVGPAHINFNGKCHGGAIFTLADTAFGLASNSHGLIAVGIDAHITYHVAADVGDTLTATAVEISRTRKIAVYRIEVTRGDGALVASFTGTVYVLARPNKAAAD